MWWKVTTHQAQVGTRLATEDEERLPVDVQLLRRKRRERLDVEIVPDDPSMGDVLLAQRFDRRGEPRVQVLEPGGQQRHAPFHCGVRLVPREILVERAKRLDVRVLDVADLATEL